MIRQVGLAWDYVPGEQVESISPNKLQEQSWKFQAKSLGVCVDVYAKCQEMWDRLGAVDPGRMADLPEAPAPAGVPACHSAISGGTKHLTAGGRIEVARGGRYLRLKVDSPIRKEGRGRNRDTTRGKVQGFSPRSRRRLLAVISCIDQVLARCDRWRFVTLTYHQQQVTPRGCKAHLRAFLKRLYDHFGPAGVVWKLEPQKRGVPHFHLLILLPVTWTNEDLEQEREWFARAWVAVTNGTEQQYLVHRYDAREDNAGWQKLQSWEQVTGYCGKYVGKVVDVPNADEWANAGRWWGIENRHMLPVSVATAILSPGQTVKVQRTLRRWAKAKTRGLWSLLDSLGRPLFGKDGKAVTTSADWIGRKALRSQGYKLKGRRPFIQKHFGGMAFMPADEAWWLVDWALGSSVEFSGGGEDQDSP